MSDYKINNQSVTEGAWALFKGYVTSEFPSAGDPFGDGNVTDSEIVMILDRDGDSKLTYKDFKNIGFGKFSSIEQILKKYGFNLGERVGKNLLPSSPEKVPSYLWKNRDFVLSVVKEKGEFLEYADTSLKKDKEVVLAAVKGWGLLFGLQMLR